MTKAEFLAIIDAYGAENLVCITFDNEHREILIDEDDVFDTSSVKTIGGIDVIELSHEKFTSKQTGTPSIDCTVVHPLDTVQCLAFCPKDKKKDIDRRTLYH